MSSLHDLQDAATAFDANLPRGDAAWVAETDAALFDALTRDLPVAPAHWLATIVTTDDLCRRLLHERMRALGTGGVDDEALDWPFDPATGAPGTEAPAPPPRLVEALLRAGRGERVHPRCVILPDGSRCDCAEHSTACTGLRPRFAAWRKVATTDPVKLTAWWTLWPEANVGAAGGGNQRGVGGFVRSKRDAAIKLIIELGGEEPVVMAGVRRAARECGISETTLERAKQEMGVESLQTGEGGFQYWRWYWPAQAQQAFMERGAGNVDLIAPHLQGGKVLP